MRFLLPVIALTLCACSATSNPALAPDFPVNTSSEPHRWLQQLVGDWELTSEAVLDPNGKTSSWTGAETVRSLGELWTVAEGIANWESTPFRSIMTLGYDPNKRAFVGTWIDTLQTTMWNYVGQLDANQRVLTLLAEGPSHTDPSQTAQYRDQVEIINVDHRRTTSSLLEADGSWTVIMTVDARRKK